MIESVPPRADQFPPLLFYLYDLRKIIMSTKNKNSSDDDDATPAAAALLNPPPGHGLRTVVVDSPQPPIGCGLPAPP